MSTPAFSTVRTERTLIQADVIIAALASAGLHPREPDTFGHWSLAGVDIQYKVEVPTEELDAAREVLQAHPTPHADA